MGKKNVDALLLTESVYSTANVRRPKPLDAKHCVTQYFRLVYCWHAFCFGFPYKFDVYMIGKTTVLVICKHKRVKSVIFAVSIKFCYKSGLAILNWEISMLFYNIVFSTCTTVWKSPTKILCRLNWNFWKQYGVTKNKHESKTTKFDSFLLCFTWTILTICRKAVSNGTDTLLGFIHDDTGVFTKVFIGTRTVSCCKSNKYIYKFFFLNFVRKQKKLVF